MKVKIKRSELLKAILIVEKALSSKTVIESLKGIKIQAKNNTLILTASKTDLVIVYEIPKDFEILDEGTIIIPGTHFSTIVKKTEEELFTITHNGTTTHLETAKSKINLFEYELSSYPDIMFEQSGESIQMSANTLITAYNHTKHAVSINTIKPILTGINFKLEDNVLTVGATDSRRLAITKFPLVSDTIKSFTIPKNLLSDVCKIIDVAEIEDFNIYISNNQLTIISKNVKIKTRLLEGEYPPIKKLIPTQTTYSYEINARDFSSILEKITLLTDKDASNLTTKIQGENLLLSSFFREIGGMEELCAIKNLKGSPFSISFDPKFLIEAIAAIGESELSLNFVDEISGFAITGLKNKENIQVISPMKVG